MFFSTRGTLSFLFLFLFTAVSQAAVLPPGMSMISQEVSYWHGNSIHSKDQHVKLDSFYGDENTTYTALKSETTARMGFSYGIMADVKLRYQRDYLDATEPGFSKMQPRPKFGDLRFGLVKEIVTQTFFGDIDAFIGFTFPTSKKNYADSVAGYYDGEMKQDIGIRHTLNAAAFLSTEFIADFVHRKGERPEQLYTELDLRLKHPSPSAEILKYFSIGPYFTYLQSFGGVDLFDYKFMTTYSTTGYIPVHRLNTVFVTAGAKATQYFSQHLGAELHYAEMIYAANIPHFRDIGLTVNYLF